MSRTSSDVTQPGRNGKPPARGMLAPSFTLMRVRGIRIGAHWSWLVVFSLVSWSLGRDVFPLTYPGLSSNTYLVMAVVSALAFFICILLHELGHAFRALKEGMKISDITLWLFGGVARFEGRFPSAGAEFRIAAAGPLVSILLVGLFGLATWIGSRTGLPLEIGGVLDYLARINLAVVIFNLVPALPLDGGRILRSWLWGRKKDFTSATITASRVARLFAFFLMGLGLVWFLLDAPVTGIWSIVMGWFLLQAAEAEKNYALVSRAFQDLNVRGLMTRDPVMFRSDTTLDELLNLAQAKPHSVYPVVDDGVLNGMVSLRTASGTPADRRGQTRIADIMTAPLVLDGSSPVVEVLDQLRTPPGRAAVMEGGRVAGILSISDVARALQLRQRGSEPAKSRKRSLGVILGALAILLPVAATLYQPPVVIISPAPPEDVSQDVEIDGVPVTELNGRYFLVAVHLARPNGIRAALAYFNDEVDMVPLTQVLPPNVSNEEYLRSQRRVFLESQQAAAAAAAQAAGLDVKITGAGAEIADVLKDSPADGKFRVGDIIVAADGKPISLVSDLVGLTTVRPAGTTFEMTVRRGSRTITVPVTSARLSGFNNTNTGVGIVTTTKDLDVDLPFEVEFKNRNIGGPSAGLIYALLISDLLDTRDIAGDRRIAASGTIQLDGRIGAVGGLPEKLVGAEEARADIFLVPQSELDGLTQPETESEIATIGVDDLKDAVGILSGQA
ncbi:MAG TPA: site-2 protease family protein [Actinomycetota bacterium]|nr:site-2 protease family protein [Actinomycetota bacterium]